jgi:hypothetical protein
MEPYPFYERGVNSYAEVHEYIRTWLQPQLENALVMLDGEAHIQVAGFRRAFVQHIVLMRSIDAESKYTFAIRDDANTGKLMRLTSWSDCYDQVVKDAASEYCKLWKIVN